MRETVKIKNGFTLIELLVVLVIILVISTIITVGYQAAGRGSRDGRRRADLDQVRGALEIYRSDCGSYPSALAWGSSLTGDGSSTTCTTTNVYMNSLPKDPKSPDQTYAYEHGSSTYKLCAYLESPVTSPCAQICAGICNIKDNLACNYSVCNP